MHTHTHEHIYKHTRNNIIYRQTELMILSEKNERERLA